MSWTYATANPAGHQIGRVLEELRLALVERCAVTAVAVPTGWTTALAGRQVTAAMLGAWQSTVTALIPLFANSDSVGVVAWNEAGILASIGAPSRLAVATAGQLSAAWLGQQYDLLDRLRWLHASVDWDADLDTYGSRLGNGADYAAAAAAWLAAAWADNPPPVGGAWFPPTHTNVEAAGIGRQILRLRAQFTFSGVGLTADWLLLCRLTRRTPGLYTYSQHDYPGVAENDYATIASQAGVSGDWTAQIGYYDTVTVDNIADVEVGYASDNHVVVRKLDVPGGLTYLS